MEIVNLYVNVNGQPSACDGDMYLFSSSAAEQKYDLRHLWHVCCVLSTSLWIIHVHVQPNQT